MNIHALVRVSEQWRSQERGWLVAARVLCARVRVRASVCPSLTDMFFSKQLHPRSVRSSRKKCSSAAFSSPGKSRNNPTVSSQNMKSNIMKKWVCISFLLPVKTFFFFVLLFSLLTFSFTDASFYIPPASTTAASGGFCKYLCPLIAIINERLIRF